MWRDGRTVAWCDCFREVSKTASGWTDQTCYRLGRACCQRLANDLLILCFDLWGKAEQLFRWCLTSVSVTITLVWLVVTQCVFKLFDVAQTESKHENRPWLYLIMRRWQQGGLFPCLTLILKPTHQPLTSREEFRPQCKHRDGLLFISPETFSRFNLSLSSARRT